MKKQKFTLTAKLWLYPGENANWHFLTVAKKESSAITEKFKALKRGWGSLPIEVTIGTTTWKTSIFPDAKSGTYLLPVKANVRRSEGIEAGDTVKFNFIITV